MGICNVNGDRNAELCDECPIILAVLDVVLCDELDVFDDVDRREPSGPPREARAICLRVFTSKGTWPKRQTAARQLRLQLSSLLPMAPWNSTKAKVFGTISCYLFPANSVRT